MKREVLESANIRFLIEDTGPINGWSISEGGRAADLMIWPTARECVRWLGFAPTLEEARQRAADAGVNAARNVEWYRPLR